MTLTAPPQPSAGPPAPPTAPRRTSARVVAILAIVLGSALILGTLVSAVFSVVRATSLRTETFTADAAGVSELDIDISGASLEIQYGDEATLTVDGAAGDWRFERDEDALRVTNERSWWSGWRWGGTDEAVLTLPRSLERTALDADLRVSGGVLDAAGTFGELDLDLAAGSMDVSGSARELSVDGSAGRIVLDLADVDSAELTLSAGALTGALTGGAPQEITADVSAGRLDLTVPDESYAVTSDVSAGDFRHTLTVDPTSPHRVSVQVSAGAVLLGAG